MIYQVVVADWWINESVVFLLAAVTRIHADKMKLSALLGSVEVLLLLFITDANAGISDEDDGPCEYLTLR